MSLADRILKHPRLYLLWQSPFVSQKMLPVIAENDLSRVKTILDVGCGPGTTKSYFPDSDYLGVDLSAEYVKCARTRFGGTYVAGDAANLPIRESASFDFVLVNSLLHHLPTEQVHSLLQVLAEVLTPDGSIHILDLVLGEKPSAARLLAQLDRGDFPRSTDEWTSIFQDYFDSTLTRYYSVGICGVPLWHMIYMRGIRKA